MDINQLKNYLRVDSDITEDDELISDIAEAAKRYIQNSTGKKYKDSCKIWSMAIKILTAHWYENRKIYVSNSGSVHDLPYSISALITHIGLSSAYEALEGDKNA